MTKMAELAVDNIKNYYKYAPYTEREIKYIKMWNFNEHKNFTGWDSHSSRLDAREKRLVNLKTRQQSLACEGKN